MMQQSDEDFRLSQAISRPSRDPAQNAGLRSLVVHRITPGPKGIWRRALGDETKGSLYCESCRRWFRCDTVGEFFMCEGPCGRVFRVEFCVLEEVVDEDDDVMEEEAL